MLKLFKRLQHGNSTNEMTNDRNEYCFKFCFCCTDFEIRTQVTSSKTAI